MKMTIESTSQIVQVNGVPARVWTGATESGIAVQALITRVAVLKTDDNSQFERELRETPAPVADEPRAFPLRFTL
jgi:hypothetical protein